MNSIRYPLRPLYLKHDWNPLCEIPALPVLQLVCAPATVPPLAHEDAVDRVVSDKEAQILLVLMPCRSVRLYG
jgi:hypothetical protein